VEKWEYGQLFTVGAAVETIYLFQTPGSERALRGFMLAVCNELGVEGWLIDSPGPMMYQPPEWLLKAVGVDSFSNPRWSIQFARRKVT
jgi:hypothetical protein